MNNSETQSCSLLWLYSIVIAVSTLLTVLELSFNNPVELDSLLYLKAAEVFNLQGYAAAAQIYPWPFFSITIALLQQLLPCSYLQAGYVINTLLQTLIAIQFIRLIKALGGNKQTLYIAAIIIIFYPYLNKIRPYITRDFGYWAFALSGLLHLIKFYSQPRLKHALLWNGFMTMATLFRIEGAIFLLSGPLIYLLPSSMLLFKDRLIQLIKLYAPLLTIIAVGLFWKLPATNHSTHAISRIPELCLAIKQGLSIALQHVNAKASLIEQYLLNNVAQDSAKLFLIGGLLSLFIGVVLKTLNPIYLFLSGYGMRYRLLTAPPFIHHLLWYFIAINLVVLSIFLGQQFFMVDRYVVFLNLILMLWIPFSVYQLFTQWQQRNPSRLTRPWLLPIVGLLFIGFATGGIIRFGYSKAYITEAGQWLNKHTPQHIKLYSNSPQLLFYAKRRDQNGDIYYLNPPALATLNPQDIEAYHYLAIWQKKKDMVQPIINQVSSKLLLIKEFQNKRGDAVLIFKVLK